MGVLDKFSLAGRTALVTGGYRGLGLAFATGLAEAGADVVIGARDAGASKQAAERVAGSTGRTVVGVGLDVNDRASGRAAIEAALEATGRFDILVNNAGACFHRPALDVPDDEWDAVFATNVDGLWKLSQEAARHFTTVGGGAIVNVGSISAQIVNRPQWQPAYNASKAAVHQLTKSLAAEWAPLNIRVNAVAPGVTETPASGTYVDQDAERDRRAIAMGRRGRPEEQAGAVLFLLSDLSTYITGQTLLVDGGLNLKWTHLAADNTSLFLKDESFRAAITN